MTTAKPNVLLIGTGGVGTIVAYEIHSVDKSTLSVVVRSDYAKVKETGWEINSSEYGKVEHWKPDAIYSSVENAAKSGTVFDFVVITTKNLPDIIKPEELAEPVITKVS
ncbi:unnamed protein product [Ambrosiozyma monospora]|uniref:Unnamed protein product n=1 Tax=Ambrosiozyma monospora TaxID=43982 RepID=A0ACB5UBC6_AMBMO|nr:unnamed protein product [Ambrosiozyma monospora]